MISTFKRNLFIGYGISLVLLILSTGASYFSITKLVSHTDLVNHTNEVIKKLDEILLTVREGESNQRGYLLTNNESFIAPYQQANVKVVTAVDDLRKLTETNVLQQNDMANLNDLVTKRFAILQQVINKKNTRGRIDSTDLEIGKSYMQQLARLKKVMEAREQNILQDRTKDMNRYAAITPLLIIAAAVLSFLITIISFLRVNKDYEKRASLHTELNKKDKEVTERISIIKDIADKISSGNYKIRVEDESKDLLGNLSGSLNKMASSLEKTFHQLSEKEWLQAGIATLNEKLIGQKNLDKLAFNAIEFITDYTKKGIGAFYYAFEKDTLTLAASIALDKSKLKKTISFGEGVAGNCALSKKEVFFTDLQHADISVNYAGGSFKPKAILAVPVFYEDILKGVIELDALDDFEPVILDFLKIAAYNIGMAIHSARDHQRLQELLEETQAQSEELQTQHSELENINSELEAQSERLQASEEELKVQQEELQQVNAELEERSRLLEEKNEQIVERNHQIQAKSEALEISTKYKSEFLANMSHELRTPLNSILLLSRLLSENHDKNLSGEQVEYAKVIQSSGNGLLTLIDEILDLSKIESGKMELEYGDVSLEGLVNELKSLFTPVAADKKLAFTVSMASDLPKIIETDKLRLEQILRNLLSNSLKFTTQGSVQLNIAQKGGDLLFTVKDTGIGIAKDKQHSIFEAFQQADGSTRRKYGGTGLGLSISRELAKLLGGDITVESEEGAGSSFTLTISVEKAKVNYVPKNISPVAKVSIVDAVPVPAIKTYKANHIPSAINDDRHSIIDGDKVILIIEDDTDFARSLLDFSRKKKYKGIVAVRGDEGVELARQYQPLGILLDIKLPVKDGWEVMEELKQDPLTKTIPVHMMSSYAERTKSISKGAIDFMDKSMAFEKMGDVFKKIEEALSNHPKKVLIVEENAKHAKALAYFLESFQITAQIENNVGDGIHSLNRNEVDCVILEMGTPADAAYNTLEKVKQTPGFENLPIIIFTGKNLTHAEERVIKQYADSIVIKTVHSYKRILDEVSLFLHLVEGNNADQPARYQRMGALGEVLKDKTVVVADDDVRNIFSLTKTLEKYGMKVLSAIDGKEAVKLLEANEKVDIVLMDMMMPEMDGYEATRLIRDMYQFRKLPIIAVTAKAMSGDREKCINAGASDYITKPVDMDQLISLLRVWLYDK